MLTNCRIAVIGVGKLGESLVQALLDAEVVPPEQITITAKHAATLEARKHLGVPGTLDNRSATEEAGVVILSVKPQVMTEVLEQIRPSLSSDCVVISTAAGVSTSDIEASLGAEIPVVRAMPNTPCMVRAGMTALAPGSHASESHLALAQEVFEAMGRTMVLDEVHLNAVTGLSGSGPAFMYVVLEALAEGGVKVGLPRQTATELVAQTMLGAARLILETGEHPAKLKDMVLTPAGCTIDGLLELEDGGLRVALIKAVVRATGRAGELKGD